ncbi:hypothetical protein GOP47_0012026 [Adiantum capillus-veneris]|uniref:Uncharacterized protein n=1 Tax=Adiantum capillus-veneris TaxID=13818 RepID=A0A9D4UV12_ADICA|nr:hypothetical protein GOP47_0012026 [Adiantum capillus-veneris]
MTRANKPEDRWREVFCCEGYNQILTWGMQGLEPNINLGHAGTQALVFEPPRAYAQCFPQYRPSLIPEVQSHIAFIMKGSSRFIMILMLNPRGPPTIPMASTNKSASHNSIGKHK